MSRVRQQLLGFTSFFALFSVFYIISLKLFVKTPKYTVPVVKIKNNTEYFDKNSKPVVVAQATDIHISTHYVKSKIRLNATLHYLENVVKPIFAILSGDLTDNYSHRRPPCYSYPHENFWMIYNETVSNSGINYNRLFEIFGNHDLFGINNWDEEETLAAIYTKTIRSHLYSYSHTRNGVKVVGFIPCEFPFGHGPQQVTASMRSKYLDELERELKRETGAIYTIVVCHYTHEFIYPISAKSKSGLNFEEMLSKYNVNVLLTGHTHPKVPEAVHYGNLMEMTAIPMKHYDGFALLSIDNGRLNYEWHTPYEEQPAIVTNPVPHHLQPHNYMSKEFPIRIVSFDKSQTKNFTVSGDYSGKLSFEEYLEDGVALYSLDAKFENGVHTIEISGDLNRTITFAVNCETGPFYETHKWLFNPSLGHYLLAYFIPFYMLIAITIWYPLRFLDQLSLAIFNDKIHGSFLQTIIFGPFIFSNVISRMTKRIKILVTIILIWPLGIPIMFYETDGKFSTLWTWGYFVGFTHVYDAFSYLCSGIYYVGYAPVMAYGAMICAEISNLGFSFFNIFEIVICFIIIYSPYKFVEAYIAEIGWRYYWWFAFPFYELPIVAIFMYIYEVISGKRIQKLKNT